MCVGTFLWPPKNNHKKLALYTYLALKTFVSNITTEKAFDI